MVNNPDWLKPKGKSYHHQLSLDCISKLIDCMEMFNKNGIDFCEGQSFPILFRDKILLQKVTLYPAVTKVSVDFEEIPEE